MQHCLQQLVFTERGIVYFALHIHCDMNTIFERHLVGWASVSLLSLADLEVSTNLVVGVKMELNLHFDHSHPILPVRPNLRDRKALDVDFSLSSFRLVNSLHKSTYSTASLCYHG